jgi:hypothetical protein
LKLDQLHLTNRTCFPFPRIPSPLKREKYIFIFSPLPSNYL